jgi:hypothetical protein
MFQPKTEINTLLCAVFLNVRLVHSRAVRDGFVKLRLAALARAMAQKYGIQRNGAIKS